MFIDVKKAHLYGVVPEGEHAYIELPGEAEKQGKCGKLIKWHHGMRNAASAWEKHYTDRQAEMGFTKMGGRRDRWSRIKRCKTIRNAEKE